MKVEYFKWWSRNLNQDMEFKVYGHWGKPVIVFPSAKGRFYEYEDFKMVDACAPFIEAGKIKLITIDSVDEQSWLGEHIHPADRGRRHNEYDRYVVEELIPGLNSLLNYRGKYITTGCSMGGYHSANFFFRHPDVFDTLISLSGVFRLNFCLGDYMDENVYLNSPICYLPSLNDPWFIEQYRRNKIIICVGQGAWEQPMLDEVHIMKNILEQKGVPAWIDIWGPDVYHDWPCWRDQMPYFLGKLEL